MGAFGCALRPSAVRKSHVAWLSFWSLGGGEQRNYMKRIYVDFNTTQSDEKERVHINTGIHPELLEWLAQDMRLIFFDEEMEVEGIAEFDSQYGFWLGRLDWSTKRDL
jgi:hypothetical protein